MRTSLAQDTDGSGGGSAPPSIERGEDVAADIERIGQGGIGVVDTNPLVDPILGGIPCGDDNVCGGPSTTGAVGGGNSGAPAGAPGSQAAPPPPPPPPTHAEIVSLVCPAIPQPEIGYNPREWGVTGFITWLWDPTAPTQQTATGSIRGYQVSCAITPTRWTFDVGEPTAEQYGQQRIYTSDAAGQESETTAVQHMWSTRGTYTISLRVDWTRRTTAGVDYPSPVTTRPYQVREVQINMTATDDS